MVDQTQSRRAQPTQLPLRLIDAALDAPLTLATDYGEVVAFSAPAPEASENQDAAYVGRRGLIAVVDGVGGNRGGKEAARLAVEALAAGGEESSDAGRILASFDRANAAIRERATGGMATAVAAWIGPGGVRPFAIGDAQVWLVGGRGKIKYRSVQHGPVGFAEEAGLIDETEALTHEDRHLIANALGDESMRMEIGPALTPAVRDTILLGSDGLFDNLYADEIVERIRSGRLAGGVEALVALARKRMLGGGAPGKPDDLTIVACRPGFSRSRAR